MAEKYLLGIDIGTSACKVVLFDAQPDVIDCVSAEYPLITGRGGKAEQIPEDWWDAVCRSIKKIIRKTAVDPQNILSVGIAGQGWSAIAVDKAGKVLCPDPIWLDTSADPICEEYAGSDAGSEMYRLCGNPFKPQYATPKIMLMKREHPEIYNATYKFLQSNGYIAYKLTGKFTLDVSNAYAYHFFDMRSGRMSGEMCGKLGLDIRKFPTPMRCDWVAGRITEEAAEQCGLVSGIPVVAGGLDAACAALGVGVVDAGQAQEQGGQAGGMSICSDRCIADPKLITSFHVVPDRWLIQGGTVGGGGALNWLRNILGAQYSFSEMDDLAATVPAGSEGLLFLPYLMGERSPIWNSKAKGVFYGLDYAKSKAHMIRATMEGVGFSLLHNLQAAKSAGAEPKELLAMGGASNSEVWTQIKADMTGLAVKVPYSDTATALGAAILAGVGVGLFKDYYQPTARIKTKKVYLPNRRNQKTYGSAFDKYRKLYEAVKLLERD